MDGFWQNGLQIPFSVSSCWTVLCVQISAKSEKFCRIFETKCTVCIITLCLCHQSQRGAAIQDADMELPPFTILGEDNSMSATCTKLDFSNFTHNIHHIYLFKTYLNLFLFFKACPSARAACGPCASIT